MVSYVSGSSNSRTCAQKLKKAANSSPYLPKIIQVYENSLVPEQTMRIIPELPCHSAIIRPTHAFWP
ncbi:Hypothetical protein GbCGDNIH5_8155 [Granulibacter bethesdensis]|nr:Hypothetical protein GbCGDNIH5_8155 [Granulibacter bethesdensis]